MTLALFSGRPDPQWPVKSTNPNFKEIQRLLVEARNGKLTNSPDDTPAKLDFKGFLVQDAARPQQSELIVGPKTMKLQQLLLKTMPKGMIPDKIYTDVLQEISTGAVAADVDGTKRFIPTYFPSNWNGNRRILGRNNCYNYANDIVTNTFAQPGRGTALAAGLPYIPPPMTAAAVQAEAVNDGLQVVNIPRPPQGPFRQNPLPWPPRGPRHLVALAVSPG